jgi:predicted CopG family antitoxin
MTAVTAQIVDLAAVRSSAELARQQREHEDIRQEAGSFSDLLTRMSERYRLDPKILAVLMMARSVEFLAINSENEAGSAEEFAQAASILKAVVHARASRKEDAVRLLSSYMP